MLLNKPSRQFTKSYLLGGLYKISIRSGFDLGRKIYKHTVCINAKIRFPIILEFLTKQATPPPLQDQSDLTRPYPSISSSLLKTVLSNLVLRNPITVAFVRLAM